MRKMVVGKLLLSAGRHRFMCAMRASHSGAIPSAKSKHRCLAPHERTAPALRTILRKRNMSQSGSGAVDLIEDACGGEAGVEAEGDGPGEFPGLFDGVLKKQLHPLGRRGVAVSEGGVDESLPEATGGEVAVRGKRGDEGGVDGLSVVSVIERSLLFAVGLYGEAVDVDDSQTHSAVAALALLAQDGLVQELAEVLAVVPAGEKRYESRRGGLRSEALPGDAASRPAPDGGLEGWVVGETVGVVLAGEAEGEGVEPFAKELGQGIAHEALGTIVPEPIAQVVRESQAVVGLAEEKDAGVGGDARSLSAKFHGTIEREIKQSVFTHLGKPPRRVRMFVTPLFVAFYGDSPFVLF